MNEIKHKNNCTLVLGRCMLNEEWQKIHLRCDCGREKPGRKDPDSACERKSEHQHKFSTMGSFCGMFSGLIYWECEDCGAKEVNVEGPQPKDKTFSLQEMEAVLNFYKKNR